MEDLLGALMQSGQEDSESEDAENRGDPLGQLLQGFLGNQQSQDAAAQTEPAPVQDDMDFGSLLQGLVGGTQGLAGGADQTPDAYGAQADAGPAPGGLDLGGLLQGVLGSGGGLAAGAGQAAPSGGGGLGNILGAIMGGSSPASGSDSFLAPIVTGLAEKLGLPPQIAQTVVAFVLGKLIGQRMQPGLDMDAASTRAEASQFQAAGLEDLLQRMNSGQHVTGAAIRDAGLAEELAAHTGLDRATAEASLQQVLNDLGTQLGAGE